MQFALFTFFVFLTLQYKLTFSWILSTMSNYDWDTHNRQAMMEGRQILERTSASLARSNQVKLSFNSGKFSMYQSDWNNSHTCIQHRSLSRPRPPALRSCQSSTARENPCWGLQTDWEMWMMDYLSRVEFYDRWREIFCTISWFWLQS